jgi:hypothetical protein
MTFFQLLMKIKYFDPQQTALSPDDQRFITQLKNSAPDPLWLRMVFPDAWYITDDALTSIKDLISEELFFHLKLLKSPKLWENPETFLREITTPELSSQIMKSEQLLLDTFQHPLSGELVPAKIPPLTTKMLEDLTGTIQTNLSKILASNSNPCQCWREYLLLEDQRANLIEVYGLGGVTFRSGKLLIEQGNDLLLRAQTLSQTEPDLASIEHLTGQAAKLIIEGTHICENAGKIAQKGNLMTKKVLETRLQEIDDIIHSRWGQTIPTKYATSFDEICPYCHKPRQLDETLSLMTPEFIRHLVTITIGGELPLSSTLLFIEDVFHQLYDEKLIPENKKKAMDLFVTQIHLKELQKFVLTKIASLLHLPINEDFFLSSKADSTPTIPPSGTSAPMKLTDDFLPDNGTGSIPNI